jgi:cytidine deaminase
MFGVAPMNDTVDWNMQQYKAIEATHGAHAPYSRFRAGAAALVDTDRVITGCNVENVSYGLGLCAECGVACALHSTGGRLIAAVCMDARRSLLMRCGWCGQVLVEHGGPDLLIDHRAGPRHPGELLPDAGADDLRGQLDIARRRCGPEGPEKEAGNWNAARQSA